MAEDLPTCIIVGASHAGAQLAQHLRKEGWTGHIQVVTEEAAQPYHRPPLSKALLSGEKTAEEIALLKPAAIEKAQVTFKTGRRVESVDRAQKQLHLDNGETLGYDKLALCTGAHVRKLDVPGEALEGVHYLRTLEDAERIRAQAREGARALIVGGGYIGLETAASLRKLGMEVTVLEVMDRILQRVTSPELSDYYTKLHESHGVAIVTGAQVSALEGHGRLERVHTRDGRSFEADLAIIGIGVVPNTQLAAQAGLEVGDGVIVDEYARTADPDIVAAGDCTRHPNELLGESVRLESVPNATEQSRTAAASLCGNDKPYHSLPWFWSDQYDVKLQIAGLHNGYERLVIRGEPSEDQFIAFYLAGDRVLAADCINSPKAFMAAKKLISQRVAVTDEQLADAELDLNELIPAADGA